MKDFFQRVFGQKPEGLLIPIFAKGNGEDAKPSFRFASNIDELVVAAKKFASEKQNVYFGCCPINKRPKKGRGSEADVGLVVMFWADVDIQTEGHKAPSVPGARSYPKTKEGARKLIDGMGLKPSIVVDSGGGLHAYWLLTEPVTITDENRGDVKKISMAVSNKLRVKAALHDMSCDQVGDLARIMRIPGTPNVKTENVRECKVIESNDETYTLDQMRECVKSYLDMGQPKAKKKKKRAAKTSSAPATAQAPAITEDAEEIVEEIDALEPVAPSPVAESGSIPKMVHNLIENDDTFKATWNARRRDMRDQSPSGYDLAIANQLIAAGASDQIIVDAIFAWRERHDKDTKKLYRALPSGGGETYIQKTIRLARENHKTSALQQQALDDIDAIFREIDGAQTMPTSAEEVEQLYGKSSKQIAKQKQPRATTQAAPAQSSGVNDDDDDEEEVPTTEESGSTPEYISPFKLGPGQSVASEEQRKKLLKNLFALTGMNIVEILRQGIHDPIYSMVDSDGNRIKIGNIDVIDSPKKFGLIALNMMGKPLPPSAKKPEQWTRISTIIVRCATLVEDTENDPEMNGRDLLLKYIRGRELLKGAEWKEALPKRPFYLENGHGGKDMEPGLYVNMPDVLAFVNEQARAANERITRNDLKHWLSILGMKHRKLSIRHGGGKFGPRYWHGTLDDIGIEIDDDDDL